LGDAVPSEEWWTEAPGRRRPRSATTGFGGLRSVDLRAQGGAELLGGLELLAEALTASANSANIDSRSSSDARSLSGVDVGHPVADRQQLTDLVNRQVEWLELLDQAESVDVVVGVETKSAGRAATGEDEFGLLVVSSSATTARRRRPPRRSDAFVLA
jgi:hypothetical protein